MACACAGCFAKPGRPVADRDLVFDNTGRGALTDFVVLARFDATTFDYSAVVEPRTDLRFVDPDTGTDLAFDVDAWNPGATSFVWVRVPEIRGDSIDDRISVFAGPGIGAADAASTWKEFDAVWHLTSSIAGFDNAAGDDYAGMGTAVNDAEGQIGRAVDMSSNGSEIDFDHTGPVLFSNWQTFTLELWLAPDTNQVANEPSIIDNGQPLHNGRIVANPQRLQIDMDFATASTFPGASVTGTGWTYLVFTYNGTRLATYSNGQRDDSDTQANLASATAMLHLGGNGAPFPGRIDEVRVSQVPRDANWVAAQFDSMSGTLATLQPVD